MRRSTQTVLRRVVFTFLITLFVVLVLDAVAFKLNLLVLFMLINLWFPLTELPSSIPWSTGKFLEFGIGPVTWSLIAAGIAYLLKHKDLRHTAEFPVGKG